MPNRFISVGDVRPVFYKPQLDVVRFLAFFAVFNHHVLPRTGAGQPWLADLANAGAFGVCLFFVLSAYLITLILLRERETTGTVQLRAFYARRLLRIWPLYLVGLGIGVLRAALHGVLLEQGGWFIAALLLAGNLLPSGGILMSHLWSISVEEQFYLVLPSTAKRGREGLAVAAGAFLLAGNLALVHFAHVHAEMDTTVWFSSLPQFQMFAFGILLALMERQVQRLRGRTGALCVMLGLMLAYAVQAVCHLKTEHLLATSALSLCAGYGCLGVACCLLVAGMQQVPVWPPLAYLGKISFGLYVFHIPAIALVGNSFHFAALDALGSLLLTCVLAVVSYQLLERPFLLIKHRFEVVHTRPA